MNMSREYLYRLQIFNKLTLVQHSGTQKSSVKFIFIFGHSLKYQFCKVDQAKNFQYLIVEKVSCLKSLFVQSGFSET